MCYRSKYKMFVVLLSIVEILDNVYYNNNTMLNMNTLYKYKTYVIQI